MGANFEINHCCRSGPRRAVMYGCMGRAGGDGISCGARRDNLSQANKLSRTCAVLLDALNRPCACRRAGGGRRRREPGGGDRPILEESTPEESTPGKTNSAHAPEPAVWSADKERQRLPVSGDAERPLPNARRDVPGRPKG
jgi:hypothetical protein